MYRFFVLIALLFGLSACEDISDLSQAPTPIGEFALGHNVVVAPNLVMGPASREAPNEQWIEAVNKAVGDRFERYDGDQLYHFGISLEGYVLAQPGIPLVLSPKSVLILKLTVWDDAAGKKLNDEPEQITVLESVDGDTLVGSGLTKTAEEQMEALSINAAKQIQRYIERQHRTERWFKRRGASAPEQVSETAQSAAAQAAGNTATDAAKATQAAQSATEQKTAAATGN